MSTTPNQKDLLAKKSDLEGILKPDDNDVLHLPEVTITLAESGQFYLAGIDKKLLTLVGNTSGNAVTLDGDAGLTFTTSGGSSTITGITSSSGNSTNLAASQSMASAKQDKIVAGTNIQIAQDGKTISATDTTYSTFNGASASADGSTGLVPKPFIADKDKYLRGDGTWQTIQATPALNDLTDVDLTTPIDGQILKYDAINQEWINANENPGVTELSGLTDVDVTTTAPTNGQGLVYNSTSEKWENANVLASASVSTLTDVNLTSLKNGQVLKYDTSTQKWVNEEDIDETNEFGPSAPTASMGKDGQIYMQYVNPTTITYSTVWTGLALSHYANQPAKVEGFNPSKYYKIRVIGVSYDANVSGEKLVSEIPESSTYSDGWKIGDRMYITTQNNGTELWVYNAPSHPTYPSYITRIDAAQPSEISKVYGKIVNNWIEFPSSSGSSTLASLSDVDITTPTDGQGLVYNNTTQKWENGTVSSASSIDTLTDVNLTNLTNGQILKYNSTSQEWVNANESGGGGGSGDSFITYTKTVTTTNYGWWTVEDKDGNVLDPDEYIIVDISIENDYKYDVLWSQRDNDTDCYFATLFQINDGLSVRSSTTYDWTITYAKKDFSGGGGGSSVTPNPTGTPTDTLSTIEIDGTIYDIVGGGSSSGFEEEQLYKASSMSFSDITVDWNWNDYDLYILYSNDILTQSGESTVLTKEKVRDLINNQEQISIYTYGDGGVCLYTPTANQLTAYSHTNNFAIIEIIGIKIKGSSGGGGSAGGVDTLWTGDICPYVDGVTDITLDYPHTNYDYILVNTYDTNYNMYGTSIFYDLKTNYSYEDTIDSQSDVRNILLFQVLGDTSIKLKNYGQLGQCTHYIGFYGVKLGGGGSSVTPNPQGTATDTLSTIEIDGTVYSVGGGEGYTEEIIYSATPSTAAPSTLTLTKPYTDFDILLFNLYRSADGVMNKYDRVVLTSKLSLNDRIQLITYNEWASYDITTTTSFTLINENRMYIGSVVGLKFGEGGGSGGSSEVTYSTTEHKVGTWIDGSDVYEKTIVLRENGTDNFTYISYVFAQSLPANINWINIESFYAKRGSGGWVDCMNNQQETILVPNPTTQGIYFYSTQSHTDVTVTIRYTKTT